MSPLGHQLLDDLDVLGGLGGDLVDGGGNFLGELQVFQGELLRGGAGWEAGRRLLTKSCSLSSFPTADAASHQRNCPSGGETT